MASRQPEAVSPDDSSTDKERDFGTAKLALPEDNNNAEKASGSKEHDDGRVELTENDCAEEMGIAWSNRKKWTVLSVIFAVQVSMNFNTSLYSNNLDNIEKKFGVDAQQARLGAMIFLVTYAFGCELWAPWSEELGRKPILQASLFLVNVWQFLAIFAPNFGSLLVARALGGLSTAGGSVTLGMVADLWESDNQQYAVAFVVLSSVGGSVLGPIVGAFTERFLGYSWNFWVQFIFGVAVQVVHFIFVPETRSTILLDRHAKKLRKASGESNPWGPGEITPLSSRLNPKELGEIWLRPFIMFVKEPIVLFLSLLSGFSDALIFMFLQSFALVYHEQYKFGIIATNMSFVPILIGYFIAYFAWFPFIKRNRADRVNNPGNERSQYESRLWLLLYTAPCLWIGLLGFAGTTLPQVHWIGSMFFSVLIGIGNYSIYMATVDYMIAAYGPYSASATGGNGFSRDLLAGVLTLPATPFFTNIGGARHLNYASLILGCIGILVTIPVYIFYFKGEWFRKRSPFAQSLQAARNDNGGRRPSSIAAARRASVRRASLQVGPSGDPGRNLSTANQEKFV